MFMSLTRMSGSASFVTEIGELNRKIIYFHYLEHIIWIKVPKKYLIQVRKRKH